MILQKYNSAAASGNTLQFTSTHIGCCDDNARTDCEYRASWPIANDITSITLTNASGVATAFPITAYATNGALIEQLNTIADTAGYLVAEKDDITVVDGAVSTVLALQGELVGVSVVTNLPATITFAAALCNKQTYCGYKFYTDGGATNSYVFNGTTTALGALVYGTTLVGVIQAAVLAASPTATAVTVTDDAVNEQWIIKVTAPLGTSAYLNSKQAEQCDCTRTYVA